MRAGSLSRARPKSNGWTLRCSCCADCLGPQVIMLGQEWRSPQGLRRFLCRSSRWTQEERVSLPHEEPHDGGTEVRACASRYTNLQRPGAHRVRGVDQTRAAQAVVGTEIVWSDTLRVRVGPAVGREIPLRFRA